MQAETRRRGYDRWRQGGQSFYRHGATIRSRLASAPKSAPYHHVAGRMLDDERPIPIPWRRLLVEAVIGIGLFLVAWVLLVLAFAAGPGR